MTYERINFVDQSVERPRTYEMTHNADGSITLVDSFGLVDELGTPINADTMNHIEDGIVNNDNRITNLEDKQIVDYKIQNMLTTGSVSTDVQGYNQLEDMYHSTFDLSKFEVVGSPVITIDGVASGFSGSSCVKLVNITELVYQANSWEINVKFTTGTVVNSTQAIIGDALEGGTWKPRLTLNVDGRLGVSLSTASGGWQISFGGTSVLNKNTTYYIKIVFTGTMYQLFISNDGKNFVLDGQTANSTKIRNTNYLNTLGANTTTGGLFGIPFNGSIDLKYFSVTADGVPVFNGNKTGLDVIKQDNYTVVGTPTISEDGVISSWMGSNKVTYGTIAQNSSINYEIQYKLLTPNNTFTSDNLYTQPLYITNTGDKNWTLQLYTQSKTNLALSQGGYDYVTLISDVSSLNIDYVDIVIKNNGESFTVSAYKPDGTLIKTAISSNIASDMPLENLTLYTNNNSYFTTGIPLYQIDMNALKLIVDGNLVYQPCLKIPYTQSKTGSKIVDAMYRDRVQDVFEQYGQAEYYTIDEENQNFTLPMGEIYGMIEKQKSNLPIGTIFPCVCSDKYVPQYTLACDGAEYTKNQFLELWNNYLTNGLLNTCTYEEYSSDISSYGSCAKFAIDTTNNKFKVPTIKNGAVIQQALTDEELGRAYNAGLPNITGCYIGEMDKEQISGINGAFYVEEKANAGLSNEGEVGSAGYFDASRSSSVYGNSDTVQQNAVALRFFIVVANGTINDSLMNWSEWASNIASINSTINATPHIVETYKDGSSFYRIWSDGWCIQGGISSFSGGGTTVTFLKEFADTNYNLSYSLTGSQIGNGNYWANSSKTTTSARITAVSANTNNLTSTCDWFAQGYITT